MRARYLLLAVVAAVADSARRAPACYGDGNLKGTLAGSWRSAAGPPPYWNLSCPFEWSKYSCVHQGALAHARAARLRFVPERCHLLDVDAPRLARTLRGRRLYFSGDSLVRQVFLALGCGTRDAIQAERLPWAEAGWPCHKTKNCVGGGVHSGFFSARFSYNDSDFVSYAWPGDDSSGPARATDVVVLEAGVRGNASVVLERFVRSLRSLLPAGSAGRPLIVHMETPPQSFPGPPDGAYDTERLVPGLPKGCNATVQNKRFRDEVEAVRRAGLSDMVDAHLSLEGLNTLGRAKIGGGVGTYGDCTHYCMPGVPDVLAQALYTLLVQRLR